VLIVVQILVNEIGCNLQGLELAHIREVGPPHIIVGEEEHQVLDVDELPEEEPFVDEPTWPLQVQDLYTLANGEVAAVGEQQGRVVIFDLDAELRDLVQNGEFV